MSEYDRQLLARLWAYRSARFRGQDHLFEASRSGQARPPVFLEEHAGVNVLVDPAASPDEQARVRTMLSPARQHRWFRSMRSSQALTQSVFANLVARGKLHRLAGLLADDHAIAFFHGAQPTPVLTLDDPVEDLGEPRRTSVDVFLRGASRVAVECKLAETEVGACSRPGLDRDSAKYCDGRYQAQGRRTVRCSLTQDGIRYWTYVPELFAWTADADHAPCPLDTPYQLVRNVLAACVNDGRVEDSHHALLLYDARNPAFQATGAGTVAYEAVKRGLKRPDALRRCSWQRVIHRLAQDESLGWLVDDLAAKYGVVPETAAGRA
jgi:hypothetical protein